MEQAQALAAIESSITDGNTETALEQLLALLEANPDLAELAQAIRIIQADLFQIKAQALRGTISADNERTAYNQVSDKVLRVIQRIKSGKTTLEDAPVEPKQAWRYYAAGGVVSLAIAFLAWNLLYKKKEECPEFGKVKTQRVMILPFKKIDGSNTTRPEFNLSDEFNDLVAKDNQLSSKAEADVNDTYDIDKNYPNPSEAIEIGKNCGVEVVVWGKTSSSKDTFEVRYRVVKPFSSTVSSTNNIPDYLNNLKDLSVEGVWRGDVKTIAKRLYMVVSMQEGSSEMALNVLNSIESVAVKSTVGDVLAIDTSTLLLKAEAFLQIPNKKEEAIDLFNQVLAVYPDNYRALRGRGLYFLKEKDYVAAVQDLHTAQPDPQKADPTMLRLRTDAYLKGGWPEMARRDLEQIKKDTLAKTNKAWINDRERKITDSIQVYQVRLEQAKSAAVKTPSKSTEAKIRIAKANIALGKPDEAVKYSESVNISNPSNTKAIEATLEAYAQKGDLEKAQETIDKAERRGVNTKDVKYRPGAVVPLDTDKKN